MNHGQDLLFRARLSVQMGVVFGLHVVVDKVRACFVEGNYNSVCRITQLICMGSKSRDAGICVEKERKN